MANMNLDLGDTRKIIKAASDRGMLRNQLAYVLATAYHETGAKMRPVAESLNYSVDGLIKTFSRARISAADANKYGRTSNRPANQQAIANCVYGGEWGKKNLGNTQSGDGWKYRGMGLGQITGRANYKKFGIADAPEKALDPEVAIRILIDGMVNGKFTGVKLSSYITLSKSDFVGARKIINGTDKAEQIAKYALEYDSDLKRIGYGVDSVSVTPAPDPDPEVKPEPVAKSKRLWTWLTAAGGINVLGFGGLHKDAQLAIIAVVTVVAAYAIYTIPQIKDSIKGLFE